MLINNSLFKFLKIENSFNLIYFNYIKYKYILYAYYNVEFEFEIQYQLNNHYNKKISNSEYVINHILYIYFKYLLSY